MTLQVALVGTDGIVLASDKLRVVYEPVRYGSLTSKILVDAKRGIAIAFAGYDVSETVARSILSDPAPLMDNWRTNRSEFESFALDICRRDEFRPYGWRGDLTIILLDDLNRVLHLSLREPGARLNLKDDVTLAGDSLNPAGFFVDVYYNKQEVDQLTFLAAHVILSGGRFSPDRIKGLEVVKCTSKGFERLSEASIEELIKRSDKLDRRVNRAIFTPLSLAWEPPLP